MSITGTSIVRYVGSIEAEHGDFVLKCIDIKGTEDRKDIDGETAFTLVSLPGQPSRMLTNVKRTNFKVLGRHIEPVRD